FSAPIEDLLVIGGEPHEAAQRPASVGAAHRSDAVVVATAVEQQKRTGRWRQEKPGVALLDALAVVERLIEHGRPRISPFEIVDLELTALGSAVQREEVAQLIQQIDLARQLAIARRAQKEVAAVHGDPEAGREL